MLNATDSKLESAPLGKLIFSFSKNSILALLFYNLYSLSDILFISIGVNEYAVGGVTATVPLLLILSAINMTLGIGGASVISRALGKGDKKLAADTAANVFAVYWLFGILVTIFGLLFLDPLLKFMGVSKELLPYAKDYAKIILIGAVTATGFSNLIRAEGASTYSLFIWVLPLSVNIVLDAIFIFVFHLGVKGAATATVISQVFSVLMSLYFFFLRKNRPYKIMKENFRIQFQLLGTITALGISSFMQQFFTAVFVIIVNRILNKNGGANYVTAFGIAIKVQSLLLIFQTGICQGVQPIIGYNYSLQNHKRVKDTIKYSLAATCITGVIVATAGMILRKPLLRIFIHNSELINLGKSFLFYLILPLPLKGFYLMLVSVFQSTGFQKSAVILTMIGSLVIQFPMLIASDYIWGQKGIGYSFIMIDITICLLSIIIWRVKWRMGEPPQKEDYR